MMAYNRAVVRIETYKKDDVIFRSDGVVSF